jgi:DNA polymerase III alpha subunit (gram-positive type)
VIIDILKREYPEQAALRVRKVTVDKVNKAVLCELSYPNYDSLDAELRVKIAHTVTSTVPANYRCRTVFHNDIFTSETFKNFVLATINQHFVVLTTLEKDAIVVKTTGEYSFRLAISATKEQMMLLDEANFEENFTKILDKHSCYSVTVEYILVESETDAKWLIKQQEQLLSRAYRREMLRPKRRFEAANVTKYIGKKVSTQPIYIAEVRQPRDNVTLCGIISEKTTSDVKSNPNLRLCKFTLTDKTGSIPVVLFVRLKTVDSVVLKATTGKSDDDVAKLVERNKAYNDKVNKEVLFLTDNTTVVVEGKVNFSDYSRRHELMAYNISKCTINNVTFSTVAAEEPKEYTDIVPVKRERQYQMSIDGGVQRDVPAELRGTMVVVDVIVTGYNVYVDRVLSIRLVKVVDGVVSETLQSHFNPEMPVAAKLLEKLGLNEDNFNAMPTFYEAIADIYKFTYHCRLVGNELERLLPMLNYYGEPFGYIFDNSISPLTEIIEKAAEML